MNRTNEAHCEHLDILEQGCVSVSEVAQSRPPLCSPMDCSPPGSSVHGVFQARILEWVAISFSKESTKEKPTVQFSRSISKS